MWEKEIDGKVGYTERITTTWILCNIDQQMHTIVVRFATILKKKHCAPDCFGTYWSITKEYVNCYCINHLFYAITIYVLYWTDFRKISKCRIL